MAAAITTAEASAPMLESAQIPDWTPWHSKPPIHPRLSPLRVKDPNSHAIVPSADQAPAMKGSLTTTSRELLCTETKEKSVGATVRQEVVAAYDKLTQREKEILMYQTWQLDARPYKYPILLNL
jgi:hypothetical protein